MSPRPLGWGTAHYDECPTGESESNGAKLPSIGVAKALNGLVWRIAGVRFQSGKGYAEVVVADFLH
jgi:hypothetical protein